MNVFIIILVLFVQKTSNTVIIGPATVKDSLNYCSVTEPSHFHTFDFFGLSKNSKDSLIKFDKTKFLRVHFCKPLIKPCNGKNGYAVCLHKSNGQEFGAGKEPPKVDVSFGKIKFKYSGDKCNGTHNYTVNFEMKCNYLMEKNVAIDMDIMKDRNQCDFHMILETLAACTKRTQTKCFVNDKANHYNLSPLTDVSRNYEVFINHNLTVILNICHSLLYGEHHSVCNSDAALCLIDKTDQSIVSYKSLGKLDENMRMKVIDGNLQIDYESETPCDQNNVNASKTMRSTIIFFCDLNATDTLPEYIGGLEVCHYKCIWRTIAACSEKVLHDQSLINSDFCTAKDPLTQYEYDLTSLRDKVFKSQSIDGTYEISVCSFLKRSPCRPGTGVCRIFNGTSYGISGGLANGKLMWKEEGPYLNYTDGNICSKGRRKFTIIAFSCGEDNSLDIEDEPCQTTINWVTNLVCKKPCATSIYDMSFERLIRSSSNYIVKSNDTEFHMNVCRPLVAGGRHANCSNGVGICKITVDGAGKLTNEINLGYTDQNLHVVSNETIILTYQNGSVCDEDTDKNISSRISFLCDFDNEQGAPQFKNYHNCVYYFEWRTKLSCGNVNGTLNEKCQVTNAHGDFWDLSVLHKKSAYQVKKQDHSHAYNISICRAKDFCNDSFICDERISYGKDISVSSDYRKNLIKFHFSNGSTCGDGSRARSILNIKCNESTSIGEPILLWERYCNSEFEWSTNTVCKPAPNNLLSSKTESTDESDNLSLNTESSTASNYSRIVNCILFLMLVIVIASCYFQKESRRSHCLACIHNFISKCIRCCYKLPQPTENLCM